MDRFCCDGKCVQGRRCPAIDKSVSEPEPPRKRRVARRCLLARLWTLLFGPYPLP